jgi:hypothetical protein
VNAFSCAWPTGINTLSVAPGYTNCGGKPSVSVGMSYGPGVMASVHLHADTVVEVCQALAVGRARIEDRVCARGEYQCVFFKDMPVAAEPHTDDIGDEAIMISIGRQSRGLAYLSKADARSLAMDLLAMSA